MPRSLGDVPLDLQHALARAVTDWRPVFVDEVSRMVRDVSALISRYAGDVVVPALPALSPVQSSLLEAVGIAAVCWMALLVITNVVTHPGSRRKGARIPLRGRFR